MNFEDFCKLNTPIKQYTNQKKLEKLIIRYLKAYKTIIDINKILYTHTELFEGKYKMDFDFELWNEFKKALTVNSKKMNRVAELFYGYKLITDSKEKKEEK